MDTLSHAERSERMGRVRSKNTKPELVVRRLIHSLGYRYRLHRTDLLGCPDLVFPCRKKLIFIHGCFWHRHDGCPNTRLPKSRLDFWQTKFEVNRDRDRNVKIDSRLRARGERIKKNMRLSGASHRRCIIKLFTVVGYWSDSLQRFATCLGAHDPEEAEAICIREHHGVAICGVLVGRQEFVDASEFVRGPAD